MQPMRLLSPVKHQNARASQRTASPPAHALRSASREAHENTASVDDTRLLCAIHGLDQDDDPANANGSQRRICKPLAILLEFLLLLEQQEDAAKRSELETICEARVLGCIARAIQKRKDAIAKCCEENCIPRPVSYALVYIVYTAARSSRIAVTVVRHDLHSFLMDVCCECLTPKAHPQRAHEKLESSHSADPRDLLLAIDPFDWCYHSLCTRLAEEKNSSIFVVPVGTRSLIHLLRGDALPTDEITELDTNYRHSHSFFSQAKKKKPLPSIFSFPTKIPSLTASSQFCAKRRRNPAFRVTQSKMALQHMATRALVALLCNLRRASPERKALLRNGQCIRILFVDSQEQHDTNEQKPGDRKDEAHVVTARDEIGLNSVVAGDTPTGLLPHQIVALQPHSLREIADAGLGALQDDEELHAFLLENNVSPPDRIEVVAKESRSAIGPPRGKSHKKKAITSYTAAAKPSLSLADRLKAVTEESQRELQERNNHRLKHGVELERSRRRQELRRQIANLEQVRQQLNESLLVMHSGRPHANPDQSFKDWIESLPTIEKQQQEQLYREEQKQRHILEMQFQRDEERKKRQRECLLMQQNDVDTPNEEENSHKERKRREFLRMQAETKLLQQRESERNTIGGLDEQQFLLHDGEPKQGSERERLLWLQQRKREAKESERMAKEDLYYVEKLMRIKQLELERRKLQAKQQVNPIEEQQRKIERMRQIDIERKLAEKESERMRTEDLLARQLRYLDAERRQLDAQRERNARKQLEREEHDCQLRWKLMAEAQKKAEEDEAKRLRIEVRQQQRWQKSYEKQVLAAWIQDWDEYGNVYYYNQLTGVSQWEAPFTE
ncbi:hypothetical protein FI667_g5288, partial [Globisporangium splendens]